jgi:hypothetical protein
MEVFMVVRISVFLEDKPGRFERVTKLLFDANVDIRGFTISQMADSGILKLLVDKPDVAYNTLNSDGFTVTKIYMIAAKISDKKGALHNLLQILYKNNINISDCYGVSAGSKDDKYAVILLEVDQSLYNKTEKVLNDNGIAILDDNEVINLR